MVRTQDDDREVLDVTEAYRRWDELYRLGIQMALSGSDEPRDVKMARLVRSQKRSLEERDAMWLRIARAMQGHADGR